jgi:tetratricopeptide (TPR) repeat protein
MRSVIGWGLVAALALGTGCDVIEGLLAAADDPALVAQGDALLRAGDLPGAAASYDQVLAEHPKSVYAAEGAAYVAMLSGDLARADSLLAAAEAEAGERVGEVKMRRAIVAMQKGDLDAVRTHGAASGLPAGALLAAEVHLADSETDEARGLLGTAAAAGGAVGDTANGYLRMLDSTDHVQVGLAEATALYALGQRDVGVEAAEELLKALPGDAEGRSDLLLVWAGRAVTAGRPTIAAGLLDAIDFPPEGQAWRVEATRAMVAISEGRDEEGVALFRDLATAGAPQDGLADALATAASLAKNRATAKTLAGALETHAGARGLDAAQATAAAKTVAPAGMLRTWLEGR